MKSVRFAYTVFIILILAVIINSVAIEKIIDSISEEIVYAEECDMSIAKNEYSEIYEKYKKYKLYISLSIGHDDLSDIENTFSEIIGAAKAEDFAGVITAKSRLTDQLGHIRRLSGINIDSIF